MSIPRFAGLASTTVFLVGLLASACSDSSSDAPSSPTSTGGQGGGGGSASLGGSGGGGSTNLGGSGGGGGASPQVPPVTFGSEQAYPSAAGIQGITLGDFNGDGTPDVATVAGFGETASVFLARGDGTFEKETTFSVGTFPMGALSGDFDGDGKLDLVVANMGNPDFGKPATLGFLHGAGDGSFAEVVAIEETDSPVALAAGDLNEDGKLDLAVARLSGNVVAVHLNNGDGTFETTGRLFAGNRTVALTSADLDHNGSLDFVSVNNGDSTVTSLLSEEKGDFGFDKDPPKKFSTTSVGYRPTSIAMADYDGDGVHDLVVDSEDGKSLAFLRGVGDGTFKKAVFLPTGTEWAGGSSASYPEGKLVAGDFNGDGKQDIVASVRDEKKHLLVFRGRGDGTFEAPDSLPTNAAGPLTAGDFDKDGKLDLAGSGPGGLVVLLNRSPSP